MMTVKDLKERIEVKNIEVIKDGYIFGLPKNERAVFVKIINDKNIDPYFMVSVELNLGMWVIEKVENDKFYYAGSLSLAMLFGDFSNLEIEKEKCEVISYDCHNGKKEELFRWIKLWM